GEPGCLKRPCVADLWYADSGRTQRPHRRGGEAWSVPGLRRYPERTVHPRQRPDGIWRREESSAGHHCGTERPVSRIRITAMTKREALASRFLLPAWWCLFQMLLLQLAVNP